MAIEAWNAFQDWFRTTDGSKLNRLFTAAEQMLAIDVQNNAKVGTLHATGAVTFDGGQTIAGQTKVALVTVVATGSNSASAARTVGTTASTIVVNASSSARGVKLPVAATGLEMFLSAPTANGVKVYAAASGQSIGTGTTQTTAFLITANTGTKFIATSATKWRASNA